VQDNEPKSEFINEENNDSIQSIGSGKLHEDRVRQEEEKKKKEFEDAQLKKNLEIQQSLQQSNFNEKKNLIQKVEEEKPTKTGVKSMINSYSYTGGTNSPGIDLKKKKEEDDLKKKREEEELKKKKEEDILKKTQDRKKKEEEENLKKIRTRKCRKSKNRRRKSKN